MLRLTTLSALPLLCLTLIACNDSTGPDEGALTAAEAQALALAIDNGSSGTIGMEPSAPNQSLAPSPEPLLAVTTRVDTFDFDLDCPRGGTSDLNGERTFVMDTEQGFITLDIRAAKGHTDCTFRTEEGGDIEVDGTIDFIAHRELREGRVAASQTHSGSLRYRTTEGKEGTCSLDITTEFSLSPGEARRSILGTVCGHDVDVSTTWTQEE